MLLTLISQDNIHTSALPEEVAGMHWIEGIIDSEIKRFGFIEAKDDAWVLSPKTGNILLDAQGNKCTKATIDATAESVFQVGTSDAMAALMIRPTTSGDKYFSVIGYTCDRMLTIGSAADNTYSYASPFVSGHHAQIEFLRDEFTITDLGSANGTFINQKLIRANAPYKLKPGDLIQIIGFTLCVGDRFLSMNNPSNAITVTDDADMVYFEGQPTPKPKEESDETEEEIEYFYPAPRFKRDIEPKVFQVDAPPAPEKVDETPVAMKIGPSMVMALAAVISASFMIMRMQENGGSALMVAPMIVMAVSMVAGAVLWPILSKRFENKKKEKSEQKRKSTYAAYLDKVRTLLRNEIEYQKQVLEENRISVKECARRLKERDSHLMDRTTAHDDFLELRIGTGIVPLTADIRFPDEHFSVEEDELATVVYGVSKEPTDIKQAPLSIDLKSSPVIGIAGEEELRREFVNGLITQIVALHTFEEVKLVMLTEEHDQARWGWTMYLPHVFDDEQVSRYVATGLEEAAEIGLTLERIAEERNDAENKKNVETSPHFVVICTTKRMADKAELVSSLAKKKPQGFSLITLGDESKDLPKQCTSIIEVAPEQASIRAKDDTTGSALEFTPDIFITTEQGTFVTEWAGDIKLDLATSRNALPTGLGFMEMFQAGNLEQLNVRSRWKEGKGSTTLATPVGIDAQGEPFILNLHEKFHGPHGLIAGTTGSGKSEFIITWILSVCVNYSPEEAAFVLIDYKGGGLAGAFDNDRVRLPHLAGTITNLDGAAINRSLVSIKSELKRRQALFNRAREVAGGDNIDIYSYLDLYREGRMSEPCPHLFIVADEFAELKQQEPEFMDELISAARIGRSLGVHLVLATQKPSGVVNDQIWSNSKFKVCLKVADKADSNEMIKRADAAEIVNVGRFYLLVGYNEYFASGQSAYTGTPYIALEQYAIPKDDSVVLVSPTGQAIVHAKPEAARQMTKPSPELVAVLSHIAEVAKDEKVQANQLWLDPIPAHITVDELHEKYADQIAATDNDPFVLNPIVGELDDPENQAQHLLTLPLSQEGNAVIYGGVGKGESTFVSSFLYSIMLDRPTELFNSYVIDLAGETLAALRNSPHVASVLTSSDYEKIENLFKLLSFKIQERKVKFSGKASSLEEYNKRTEIKIPAIVVSILNIAAFIELMPHLEDVFQTLTREANRYGIYFVVCANTYGDVRYKLKSNFKQVFTLPLADEDEYLSVFGSMKGVIPPKTFGRGLIKIDDKVYEYQSAFIHKKEEDFFEHWQHFCKQLKEKWCKDTEVNVEEIPVLPEVLRAEELLEKEILHNTLPLGLYEKNFVVSLLDLESTPLLLVGASQSFVSTPFFAEECHLLNMIGSYNVGLVGDDSSSFGKTESVSIRELASWFNEGFPKAFDRKKHTIIMIPDAASALLDTSISVTEEVSFEEAQRTIKTIISESKAGCGYSFIIGINSNNLNRLQNEIWGQKLLSQKTALWIGDGLSNQYVLRVTTPLSELKKDVGEGTGYLIEKGKASLVKLLMADE